MEYEFTLKFQLPDRSMAHDAIVERLGAVGCTDALVGLGVAGQVGLAFVRDATSAETAFLSAIDDVEQALPGVRLIEAGPDLVGLTDIADQVGVSRQAMRKLMVVQGAAFPAPMHAGTTSIWHLAPVLSFLQSRGYPMAQAALEVAQVAMRINIAKENHLLAASGSESRGTFPSPWTLVGIEGKGGVRGAEHPVVDTRI